MRKKRIRFSLGILTVLLVGYLLGPQPEKPDYTTVLDPTIPEQPGLLENYIQEREDSFNVKEGCEANIVWFNDSLKNITEYSVVYLHGFSASHEEGNPAHIHFAKKFGCNLYLSRLADHALDVEEPMKDFTVKKLWESALEAYAIGKKIGRKVILVSTSTGGTLSLKMAAELSDVHALILLSPNMAINASCTGLLNNPWGKYVAKLSLGGDYVINEDKPEWYYRYWYGKYHINALPQLQQLIETTTKSTFQQVTQPVLLLYYYKNEEEQDNVVRVDAMLDMFGSLATVESLKRKAAIPEAGDHVIGSELRSGAVEHVEQEMEQFAIEVLDLIPVD